MQVWFETHSTSVDNERGVASGHLDAALSATGRDEAAGLGLRLADVHFLAIYTSDLRRAVSTAEIAFGGSLIPRFADRRLRECDYGEYSGCPARQIEEARGHHVDRPFPGGESIRGVVRRVADFLEALRPIDGPILIIGHRATWYALENLLNGRDLHEAVTAPWQWQPGWKYGSWR